MFIEVGPASLVVTGRKAEKPCSFDERHLRGILEATLSEIRDWLPVLRQKAFRIRRTSSMPDVARHMVEAVAMIDDKRLTPMAAVAGAVSDRVREILLSRYGELDTLFINNGGDIAAFSRDGRPVRIGLGDIGKQRVTGFRMTITGRQDFGVATSGFGGRSLTLGIADMVTVIAASGALADAAATDICNTTVIESDRIERKKALFVDEGTDIPEELVTVRVGLLRHRHIAEALENGLARAQSLKTQGIIAGAVLLLRDHMVSTIGEEKTIQLEVSNGDQKDGDRC